MVGVSLVGVGGGGGGSAAKPRVDAGAEHPHPTLPLKGEEQATLPLEAILPMPPEKRRMRPQPLLSLSKGPPPARERPSLFFVILNLFQDPSLHNHGAHDSGASLTPMAADHARSENSVWSAQWVLKQVQHDEQELTGVGHHTATPYSQPVMKDEDFQSIMAGLEDAIAFVKGDTTKGRVAAGPDVKAIRAKTKLRAGGKLNFTQ